MGMAHRSCAASFWHLGCVDLHTGCYSCVVWLCMGSHWPYCPLSHDHIQQQPEAACRGSAILFIIVSCHVALRTCLQGTPLLFAESLAVMGHTGCPTSLFLCCRMLSKPQSGISSSRDQSGCMGMNMASMCQTFQMGKSTSIGLMAQSTMGSGGMANQMAEGYSCPHQVRLHCYLHYCYRYCINS